VTAVAERPAVAMPRRRPVVVLARLEAKRFARHPLFLGGTAFCAFVTVTTGNDAKASVLAGDGFFPALFVGVASMVVAYRLTRSTRRSAEALDAAPTPDTTRTAALCLACLVPAAAGAFWLLFMLFAVHRWPPQPWLLGTFGPGDRVAILAGESVLPCLGAPLLGVAAARWIRHPGGVLALLIVVLGWVSAGLAVAVNSAGGLLSTALRLGTPFTFFATSGRGNRTLDNWPGSPWWYLLELAALCALAAVAALLHGAADGARTRLLRVGALCLAAGLVAYLLAVTGGLSRVVTIHPDGTRTTAAAQK
jgi:hypothetical protein